MGQEVNVHFFNDKSEYRIDNIKNDKDTQVSNNNVPVWRQNGSHKRLEPCVVGYKFRVVTAFVYNLVIHTHCSSAVVQLCVHVMFVEENVRILCAYCGCDKQDPDINGI